MAMLPARLRGLSPVTPSWFAIPGVVNLVIACGPSLLAWHEQETQNTRAILCR